MEYGAGRARGGRRINHRDTEADGVWCGQGEEYTSTDYTDYTDYVRAEPERALNHKDHKDVSGVGRRSGGERASTDYADWKVMSDER